MNAADFPRGGSQDAIAALASMPGFLEAAITRERTRMPPRAISP